MVDMTSDASASLDELETPSHTFAGATAQTAQRPPRFQPRSRSASTVIATANLVAPSSTTALHPGQRDQHHVDNTNNHMMVSHPRATIIPAHRFPMASRQNLGNNHDAAAAVTAAAPASSSSSLLSPPMGRIRTRWGIRSRSEPITSTKIATTASFSPKPALECMEHAPSDGDDMHILAKWRQQSYGMARQQSSISCMTQDRATWNRKRHLDSRRDMEQGKGALLAAATEGSSTVDDAAAAAMEAVTSPMGSALALHRGESSRAIGQTLSKVMNLTCDDANNNINNTDTANHQTAPCQASCGEHGNDESTASTSQSKAHPTVDAKRNHVKQFTSTISPPRHSILKSRPTYRYNCCSCSCCPKCWCTRACCGVLRMLVPENSPLLWTMINSACLIWSCCLYFWVMDTAGPLERPEGFRRYLIWNGCTTSLWLLQIGLTVSYLRRDASWLQWIEFLIAVYFVTDSIQLLFFDGGLAAFGFEYFEIRQYANQQQSHGNNGGFDGPGDEDERHQQIIDDFNEFDIEFNDTDDYYHFYDIFHTVFSTNKTADTEPETPEAQVKDECIDAVISALAYFLELIVTSYNSWRKYFCCDDISDGVLDSPCNWDYTCHTFDDDYTGDTLISGFYVADGSLAAAAASAVAAVTFTGFDDDDDDDDGAGAAAVQTMPVPWTCYTAFNDATHPVQSEPLSTQTNRNNESTVFCEDDRESFSDVSYERSLMDDDDEDEDDITNLARHRDALAVSHLATPNMRDDRHALALSHLATPNMRDEQGEAGQAMAQFHEHT